MADDDSLSSDDSDDDFLTMGDDGRSQDREAMIRKKLMESFYGKTAPTTTPPAAAAAGSVGGTSGDGMTGAVGAAGTGVGGDGFGNRDNADGRTKTNAGQRPSSMDGAVGDADRRSGRHQHEQNEASDDLDSPYFDSDAHTSKHVLRSNVHTLLETEERLALQVRTLDSTMQTLVYENYSKFIDATDAIRSIGVSVTANEEGLARLSSGMTTIDQQSREVEDALGTLRDAVAEKLRVKRLLTRLDSLLKLPSTLKQQVGAGTYRLATKSYFSAHAILSKHSAGFESLKAIELDCHVILTDMVASLKRKLLFWSGNSYHMTEGSNMSTDKNTVSSLEDEAFGEGDDADMDNGNESGTGDDGNNDGQVGSNDDEGWLMLDPPKTVSDIFECAGTLMIVLPKNQRDDDMDGGSSGDGGAGGNGTKKNDGVSFDSGLTPTECKSMALSATVRFLDRVLDTHQVELQDDMFDTGDFMENSYDGTAMLDASRSTNLGSTSVSGRGKSLIPTAYLDNVLEAATLFGVSFSLDGKPIVDADDRQMLNTFVADTYNTFLSHVKALLLERSAKVDGVLEDDQADEPHDSDDEHAEDPYAEVSAAMKQLLQTVRELASGLALPDVGVNADFASRLVEQAVEVTETMARRRVAEKFVSLRIRVVKECFGPFVKKSVEKLSSANKKNADNPNTGAVTTPRVADIVQLASIALSDGMQLVDDTIRSILAGGAVVSDLKGVDFTMVENAVRRCSRGFAAWLASSLEVLAGCERQSLESTIDADPPEETTEEGGAGVDGGLPASIPKSPSGIVVSSASDDLSELSGHDTATEEKLEDTLLDLATEIMNAEPLLSSQTTLAVAEMCRLAQRSVMDNIQQSISASGGGTGRKKKVSSDLFKSVVSEKTDLSVQDKKVANRFMLAASRILGQYSMTLGLSTATMVCRDMDTLAEQDGEDLPTGPRNDILRILKTVKQTSLDCACVFGGKIRAGPLPDPPQDEAETLNTGSSPMRSSMPSNNQAIMGLQLDVERMFIEKVPAYSHPSEIVEFTRNNIVAMVLKVTFNALIEKSRLITFRSAGFRQLHVDVQFLRYILPHYVKDESATDGANSLTILDNILNEFMTNAGNRAKDIDSINQVSFYNPTTGETTTIQSIIRTFLKSSLEGGENNQETDGNGTGTSTGLTETIPTTSFIIEEDEED